MPSEEPMPSPSQPPNLWIPVEASGDWNPGEIENIAISLNGAERSPARPGKRPREQTEESLDEKLEAAANTQEPCGECNRENGGNFAENVRVTRSMKKKAARISPERRRVLGRLQGRSQGSCHHLRRTISQPSLSQELSSTATNETNKVNDNEENESQVNKRPMGARPKGFKRGKK